MTARAGRLLIALAALAGFLLTLSLGAWQLSRAAEKTALHASIAAQGSLAPVTGSQLVGADPVVNLLHRRVLLKGRWLASATVFLDNRQMNGRVGFLVVTPLRLEASSKAVLVLRGWAARDFQDRSVLPPVATPEGPVQLQGLVVPPPSPLYDFGGVDRGTIRQNLDIANFATELRQPLLALAVQQEGQASEGLLRHWPAPLAGVEKHQGYALQWFALSGLLAFLYVWFQIVQPLQSRRRRS